MRLLSRTSRVRTARAGAMTLSLLPAGRVEGPGRRDAPKCARLIVF